MRYIKVTIEAGNGDKVYLQDTHFQAFETKAQQLAEQVPMFYDVMAAVKKHVDAATEASVAEATKS
tara:strand:+ start:30013 stop:30210 length:198 start_codon:yes stop_codon:yes gene_type:complete